MSAERIEAMKQFIEQYPNNPFPRYALALDLKNAGRPEEAIGMFRALMERIPSYVPTYLQFGMLLEEAGQVDEARIVFSRGIEAAKAAGDAHALGEIEGRLSALE